VVEEIGRHPAPFSQYSLPLLRFSRENHFVYKYREWPSNASVSAAAHSAGAGASKEPRS
jgi:hypothetical protein